jgi:monoamine oxidase
VEIVGRRTPLMCAMRELAEVHASLPDDRALSVDEAIHLRTKQISRRHLLKGAGVLGAAAAVTVPPLAALARPRRHGPLDPRVVVVGAGLAGLSCAYKLQQNGIRADLYEARDRVGGRCWTARAFDGGQVAEHGGEFIDTRHVQLRRLIAALGLQLDDLWPAYDAEGDVGGLLVLDGALRDRHEVREHFDVVIRRLVRDAKRVGPYRWGQAGPAAKAFDRMTMREWMDANVPGGSTSLLGRSIDVGLTGFWGIDPEDTSAITLLDTYITPYPGGPADERYHVRGGNDQIPTMLADLLPPEALHLESPLESLAERSDGTFELVFGGGATPVIADHVVLCLPFTTLRDVDLDGAGLSRKRLKAIDQLGMGTNAKVLLQFRDRFPTFGWNGSFTLDAPKSDSWDSALAQPGDGGLLTIYTGGATGAGYPTDDPHAVPPASVVDDALTFLDTYLPGMRDSYNGRSWLDSWVDDPWVKGSYAAFLPGQWTSFFGYMGRPEGNVHFAGEHTSTYSQGYLNGGVETGLRAAREVVHATGRRARPLS